MRTGELGDNLYVVESGSFNVFVNSKQVATRGKGTCFGQSRDMRDRMWQLRRCCCDCARVWFGMMVADFGSSVRFGSSD